MSEFEQLPPDQRATLSLLLRRHKSYADVAEMLDIAPKAVHDRAHAALSVLEPALARGVDAGLRGEVCDYLLGQQPPAAAERTRAQLVASAPAREWAKAVAVELVHVTAEQLPEIPDGPRAPQAHAAAPAPDPAAAPRRATTAPEPAAAGSAATRPAAAAPGPAAAPPEPGRPRVSRVGGAALLVVIAAVIVVVVVLVVTGGKGTGSNAGKRAAETGASETGASETGASETNATESSTTETSTTATGSTGSAGSSGSSKTSGPSGSTSKPSGSFGAKSSTVDHVEATIPLTAPREGKATGGVVVATEEGKRGFLIAAKHLEPPKGFQYAAWLINSKGESVGLGVAPVKKDGDLFAGNLLPKDASSYDVFELTRNTESKPSKPGEVVLEGTFKLS